MIKKTDEEYIYFRVNGDEYLVESYGIKTTIIDYSYARLTQGI